VQELDASYIGILLGPERTRECFFLGKTYTEFRWWSYRASLWGGWCCCESGLCVLFENCTVDASIFVVSNEERTVDALAPGADEGRRRLR
jgi:hypothetical protein